MHLNLSPEMEAYLQSKVESGDYSNASEVVRDAIRRMKEDEQKLERLRAAIRKGQESLEKYGGIPYTKEWADDILRKAKQRAKSGKPRQYDPDVIGPGDDEPWGGS